MSATDPFEIFADLLTEEVQWTPEKMEASREQYEREQIASAQSEAAWAANVKLYNPAQVARRF